MTENAVKRKLTAILCADVKGYSRMMGEDEVGTFHILSDYLEIMDSIIAVHRGHVFSSPGDAILAQFASVVDAIQCAVEIQEKIEAKNANIPDDRKMQFRIGVNIGDVIEKGSQIYGNGVNIAARLETLADPGGVCISKAALEQIEDKLPLGYEYIGEKTVKNIAKPITAYKVLFEIEGETTGAGEIGHKHHSERYQKIKLRNEKIRIKQGKKVIRSKVKIEEKGAKIKLMDRNVFHKHLWIFAGVNSLLIIINLLTLPDFFWFHWPALIWGLLIFIHWIVWIKDSNPRDRSNP